VTRCVRHRACDLESALVLLGETAQTAMIDVEPLVATWGSSANTLATGLGRIEARAERLSQLSILVFMTNSRRGRLLPLPAGRVSVSYVSSAGKPWRLDALRQCPDPIVVIGDQILTDGLLAWRLRSRGARFIHVSTEHCPWWPRIQACIGSLLGPILFKDP
jgi:hypothetical protein